MLKKYSSIFGNLMVWIYDLESALYRPILDKKDADQAETETLGEGHLPNLRHISLVSRNMADELALDSIPPLLDRIDERLSSPYLVSQAYADIRDLRSRIDDQLKSRLFLYVPPKMAAFYEAKQLLGSEVESIFPSAIDDIEGAGKCLALGQGTACVMHLMRVMEAGLKGLAKPLGIPYAPSWESYLTQIQHTISLPRAKKSAKWKRDEPFYRDVSGDLMTVKQAWRNPSMHIIRKYSSEEAEEIYRAVKRFMQHLATKIGQSSSSKRQPS